MATVSQINRRGTRAAQPAANTVANGTQYYVTDEFVTERSNGSAWQDISDAGTAGGAPAESAVTFTDITTNNTSTTKHGYAPKLVAPSAGIRKVLALDNGETVLKNVDLFDNTNPADTGTAAPGTSLVAARRDHVHTGAGGSGITELTGNVTAGPGSGSVAATIANAAVTYAKIQNVSATDKLLGRSTAGAGVVEEITCTAAGRALIDDAAASNQRTTLGLGALAVKSTIASTDIDANAVTFAKMQAITDGKLLGASGGTPVKEITVGSGLTLTSSTLTANAATGAGLTAAINVGYGNGADDVTGGRFAIVEVPFACTINRWSIFSTETGSLVVDIYKSNYASAIPTSANTITASAKPTLSSAVKAQSSTLTGWTTSIAAGDILVFNIDSASGVKRFNLSLVVTRT